MRTVFMDGIALQLTGIAADSVMSHKKDIVDSPKNEKQKACRGNDAIAGDTLFVTHRAQALNAPGGQVVDQLRVVGGRALEMILQPAPRSAQIEFAEIQF